jgi:ribosomal protein L6P/L9E
LFRYSFAVGNVVATCIAISVFPVPGGPWRKIGLAVKAEKNLLTIAGIDKELVGSFSAKLRAMKKPEPYKGKGFRYHDEGIRRKQGKKSA